MPPQTIDDIIGALNAIIDDAVRTRARIGYFAALYGRVTMNIRRAIVAGGVFDDNARMARLDVVFANRFLDAWAQHGRGERAPACWQVAFAALDEPGALVVQHLMLGMNAHIHLDLGVAAATVASTPAELAALGPDFRRINDVLARLVRIVEDQLSEICPRLRRIDECVEFGSHQEKLFDFGLGASRELAWGLAQQLVAAPRGQWDRLIAARDAETAAAGRLLYPLCGPPGLICEWVRAHENADISWNIQVVAS